MRLFGFLSLIILGISTIHSKAKVTLGQTLTCPKKIAMKALCEGETIVLEGEGDYRVEASGMKTVPEFSVHSVGEFDAIDRIFTNSFQRVGLCKNYRSVGDLVFYSIMGSSTRQEQGGSQLKGCVYKKKLSEVNTLYVKLLLKAPKSVVIRAPKGDK